MTSSSWKRVKTLGNKRKDPKRFYSNKFLSHKHEQHFKIVQDRRLLMERKVGCIPSLAPQFGEELERREWENVAAYPTPANIAVVKEFYTNARPFGNTHTKNEQCQFALSMEEGANFFDVERTLCVPGGHFQRNRNDVIENEIQTCASFVNNKAPLGHPSLITHLCELVGVNTSTPPMERRRKEIDSSYYNQYCVLDEAAQQVPPPHPPKVHRRGPTAHAQPQDAEPFQMRDTYMSLMESRMKALHSGQDQAQASGAGAVEASAMEDDDEDDDYEHGDEEEDDKEEEEDSDDSRG
ncbi:hypothetical protein LR48_Vigan04g105500 [Vigna angularis]|uniref:Putative plant transposon protein domain-containing protein n=1 Tax=Phaseolus angularis TaxID=3914 RepID=A0A0L9UE85_PHAAN|nr:hypothetical protein LR48_Vigan04g105500 [Vigna angularis]